MVILRSEVGFAGFAALFDSWASIVRRSFSSSRPRAGSAFALGSVIYGRNLRCLSACFGWLAMLLS